MAAAFNPESFDLLQENHEQRLARDRIKAEDIVPITGPPGTGKSTVISHSCFDLLQEYSPVLIVSPTNAMINSILAKIDYLVNRAKIKLPKGFIIRYGNTAELTYSYPYLNNSYTLDALVHQQHSNIVGSSGGGIGSGNKIADTIVIVYKHHCFHYLPAFVFVLNVFNSARWQFLYC